ncbi:hypothetical protein [Methylacidimicrobium sp. B4]|uniref:hypothetical protein n=1 Tax=Methylacidimicrobium sp. B4 TaxID=2796139 RepID=UPI001A903411|nr:hypothetical protein [Methylacidimicrobium sp. B4]QSR84972.1 hypothetical protein MacB4_01495 [Methylacidimicrobium sp. B4]
MAAYTYSAGGMTRRNQSISATAAPYAAHGRVLVFVGRDHSGFLPNEHFLEAPPDETYPGLNYLFETKYHLPSIALAQNQISPQGYLAQSAVPLYSKQGVSLTEKNQQEAAATAQDPYRAPIRPDRPAEESLPDAVRRRQQWRKDTQPPSQEKKRE